MAERAQRRRQGGGHPAQVKGQREHHGQRQPTLVRSLIDWGLLDQLRLYLHPLVLGSGERLFDEAKVRLYSSSGQWGRDACLPAEQATTPTSSAGRHVPEGLLQRESPRERPLRGTCSRPRPPGLDGQGVGRQRHLRCLVHGGRHRGNQDGEGFLQARRPVCAIRIEGRCRGRLYFSRRRVPSSTPRRPDDRALSALLCPSFLGLRPDFGEILGVSLFFGALARCTRKPKFLLQPARLWRAQAAMYPCGHIRTTFPVKQLVANAREPPQIPWRSHALVQFCELEFLSNMKATA